MQPVQYVPIIVLLILLYLLRRSQKLAVSKQILQKRTKEEREKMKELAMRFIGKECIISSFDGNHQFNGTLREVSDGAVLIEKNGKTEAINLDFVIRIREFPKNKKGKNRTVVID